MSESAAEARRRSNARARLQHKWQFVIDSAAVFRVDAVALIAAAGAAGLSPAEVAIAFTRTRVYLETNSREGAAFEDFDAVPPGKFDIRVVLQDKIWIDILRRRHSLEELGSEGLGSIVDQLHQQAAEIYAVLGDGDDGDAVVWVDQTPLMKRLRSIIASESDGEA